MMTSAYERISRRLLNGMPRPKRFCRFRDSHLSVGIQSSHRTTAARVYRTFWRMKLTRLSKEYLNEPT